MPILIKCSTCSQSLTVPDQAAGKRGKCPKCGTIVAVPSPPVLAAATTDAPVEQLPVLQEVDDDHPPRSATSLPSQSPPTQPKQSLKRVLVVATAVIVTSLIAFTFALYFHSKDTAGTKVATKGRTQSQAPAATATSAVPAALPGNAPATNAQHTAPTKEPPNDKPQRKVAKSFDEVSNAIVKFEIPTATGINSATGFLINDRGWIATNNHVAAQLSTVARVKWATGQKQALEGVVAIVPERDLAILKVKQIPPQATILDLSYQDQPKQGMAVFVYGHPLGEEFSLSKGIVSRLLTTAQLAAAEPNHIVVKQLHSPSDAEWIRIDATVLPGNSGGPLLDETCRVIGINTFAHPNGRWGYASHIRYLRELLDKVPEKITPLKSPQGLVVISPERLPELFRSATAIAWNPKNADDYNLLGELAMTLVACRQPNVAPKFTAVAKELVAALKAVPWTEDRLNAINKFAAPQLGTPSKGVVCAATIVAKASDGKQVIGLLLQIPDAPNLLLAQASGEDANLPKGTRVLVMGITLPQTSPAKIPGQSETHPARHLVTGLVIPLK